MKRKFTTSRAISLLLAVLVLASALCLNSYERMASASTISRGLMSDIDAGVTGFTAEALDGIYAVNRVYIIPESATVAPEPQADGYGFCEQGSNAGLLDQLDAACDIGLVNRDELLWNENIATWESTGTHYYADETIMAVLWREKIGVSVYNFVEIFISHPSQFRRLLTDDTYGSNTRQTTSAMSENCNAVVGMNGDFYGYRSQGVVIYHGTLYKNRPSDSLENCFVDRHGNLLLPDNDPTITDEQYEAYIEEHGINFCLSFGPAIVRDGETITRFGYYSFGQIEDNYSRAAIGQLGELHYLLCTVDGGRDGVFGTDVYTLARVMGEKGCRQAYTLDGGQTATIYFDGSVYNRVGYGNERLVSDIIYFASALPEE